MTLRAMLRRALTPTRLGPLLLMALLCAGCGVLAYALARHALLVQESVAAQRRLEFYAQSLAGTLARYEALPELLALDRHLFALLARPDDTASYLEANAYLKAAQTRSGVTATYLIDAHGRTLAASNWDQPGSFVNHNYAFRPYFREAMNGTLGRFYGIGATTGEPGYFLAAPLREGKDLLGVVVIKAALGAFEQALAGSGDLVLVVDSAGVVFLSPVAEWRYHSLTPLPLPQRAALQGTRQYGTHPLSALLAHALPEDGQISLTLPGEARKDYRLVSRPVGTLGWRLALLDDPAPARRDALAAGCAATFALAFLFALGAHWQLRRARTQELRRLHDLLETRIAARTADLSGKVTALEQTERILRETRDAAVQAGKLAVLGQMSAGMSHELNQPLAALQTFSDNAVTLLELGHTAEVADNLAMIRQLTARMGRIVTQLRSFARQAPATRVPVSVARAVDNALLIIEPRRRELGAQIKVAEIAPSLAVAADPTRLEQILVNLLRNGLDAMHDTVSGDVHIELGHDAQHVYITVRDEGLGIPAEVEPHLFEPFYTTKPVGQGLGLGLAISLAIAESLGGELKASNAAQGGAVFTLRLDLATFD